MVRSRRVCICLGIENTSWKVLAYGIYALVVFVSEISLVRFAHSLEIRNPTSERSERVRFLIQKQRVRKYRTKHFPGGIVFIMYILRQSSFWRPFYFKSLQNAKICRYSPRNDNEIEVKTFVKNINTSNRRSNLNCLFWMHNWRWMNLRKMAGLNILKVGTH